MFDPSGASLGLPTTGASLTLTWRVMFVSESCWSQSQQLDEAVTIEAALEHTFRPLSSAAAAATSLPGSKLTHAERMKRCSSRAGPSARHL